MSGITEEERHSAQIAALMLQPLLENAVNYGVEPTQSPTLIEVRISCSLGTVDIAVVNPVADAAIGDALAPGGNRMALGNIRERLALLYDVEAQLTSGMANGMFEVRLRFPYVRVRS
jgi:two-component system sensor histidine kinase AlgZ